MIIIESNSRSHNSCVTRQLVYIRKAKTFCGSHVTLAIIATLVSTITKVTIIIIGTLVRLVNHVTMVPIKTLLISHTCSWGFM